jgi:hypothetical protein
MPWICERLRQSLRDWLNAPSDISETEVARLHAAVNDGLATTAERSRFFALLGQQGITPRRVRPPYDLHPIVCICTATDKDDCSCVTAFLDRRQARTAVQRGASAR